MNHGMEEILEESTVAPFESVGNSASRNWLESEMVESGLMELQSSLDLA